MSEKIWRAEEMGSEGWAVFAKSGDAQPARYFEIMIASNLTEEDAKLIASAPKLEARLSKMEEAGIEAFLNDDGLLWIGAAADEHGYGMEFVGITLPKDRYFAFLKALAEESDGEEA